MFIIPDVIRGLSHILQFSARGFPRRVISHPYCYVHYDVLDTTCVIGCLMNDILILFLCLLSRMLSGVFLISFSLVPEDFPASFPTSTKKMHHRCINPKTDRLRSTNHQSQLLPHRVSITNPEHPFPLPSGYPKVNQDFVCLLLGERRYELLSMIEQSDIVHATSLPNATNQDLSVCKKTGPPE